MQKIETQNEAKVQKEAKLPKHRRMLLSWPVPITTLGINFVLVDENHLNILHLSGERLEMCELVPMTMQLPTEDPSILTANLLSGTRQIWKAV